MVGFVFWSSLHIIPTAINITAMSFRGRGASPGGRSFSGGRSSGGRGDGRGFGGGRGGRGGRGPVDDGPPAEVVGEFCTLLLLFFNQLIMYIFKNILEVGVYMHSAESEMVCRLTNAMIPYFNAGIYLENKAKVGKVEEVFGPTNKVYFTIKPDTGVNPASFKPDDKVYIGTDKLLPLARFTNEAKSGGGRGGGRGAAGGRGGRGPPGRGGGRGPPGRGGFAGGRGGGRGAPVFGRGGAGGRGGSSGFSRGGGRGRG